MSIIPIVFSMNDNYVPYFAACLLSLQDVANDNDIYEVYVLNREISYMNKKTLLSCLTKKNITLSFVDMNSFIEQKDFKTSIYFPVETFFRLYIPIIFKDRYEKVLYCDTDIIFCADPAILFIISLENNKLAAARDNIMNGFINLNPEKRQYFTTDLAIKNTDNYFNAGVLLFNIPSITENDIANIEQMAGRRTYSWFEQDILNSYYQGKVTLFNSKWNYISANSSFLAKVQAMEESHKNEYMQAAHDPQIIHYAGLRKPWFYPEEELASIWWAYARKTVFYREFLCNLLNFQNEQKIKELNKNINQWQKESSKIQNTFLATAEQNLNENRLCFVCDHIWYFRWMKWRFYFCKCLSYGKRRGKYRAKYKAVRDLIRKAKIYVSDLWRN